VLLAGGGVAADEDPLGHVEPLDGAPVPVAFPVDPNLPVVIDAGLELDSHAVNWMSVHLFGKGHADPVPHEAEAVGHTPSQIVAGLPARIVVIG